MPWQIIVIIAVCVALYLLADAFFDVSAKISKATRGWSLPSLPALNIGAFFAKGWVKLAAIPVVIAVIWGGVELIKDSGRNEVRVEVAEQNTVNVERQVRAQVNFERDVRETMENAALRNISISEEFGDVEQTILEAQGRDAIAAAHAAGVERLRTSASSRHAAVFSDYLSSVSDRPMRSPPPA